jgi:hypothetical protein
MACYLNLFVRGDRLALQAYGLPSRPSNSYSLGEFPIDEAYAVIQKFWMFRIAVQTAVRELERFGLLYREASNEEICQWDAEAKAT